jgi:hypothetical protein
MRRLRTGLGIGALVVAGVSGCGTSGTASPTPTASTCAKAVRAAGGIPSANTSSISNEQKLQFILDECPSRAALNAGLTPYVPAGQSPQSVTAQVDQTFATLCQQIGGGSRQSPLCSSLG